MVCSPRMLAEPFAGYVCGRGEGKKGNKASLLFQKWPCGLRGAVSSSGGGWRLGAAARGRLSGELHARLEVGQKTLAGGGSLCYGGAKKAVQLLPSPRLPLLMLGLKGFILSSRKQFHPAP